jgi:hypothetical protein
MNMAEQWREILKHLASLRDAKSDAPRHRARRHSHKPSPVVQTFARAEMRRRQHKG